MEQSNLCERLRHECYLLDFRALEVQMVGVESCQKVPDFGLVAKRTCWDVSLRALVAEPAHTLKAPSAKVFCTGLEICHVGYARRFRRCVGIGFAAGQ